MKVAKFALRYMERNECQHDETYRGGAIWTIYDGCGHKWADDEGGFQPYQEPREISDLRDELESLLLSAPLQENRQEQEKNQVALGSTDSKGLE
jgi:hypothetical protein